ncbi:MAG: DUF1059 domain-containing protein [Egibacteraceae bacterium]
MKEFRCVSPECKSEFTATDKEELKRKMAQHLKDAHNVQTPTQTIVNYLETTAVKEK